MSGYLHVIVTYLQQVPWVRLMVSLQWVFIAYFAAINIAYLVLNYISAFQIARYMREYRAN